MSVPHLVMDTLIIVECIPFINVQGLGFRLLTWLTYPHPPTSHLRANDEFYLATSDEVMGATGEYFVGRSVYTPPPPAQDEAACRRLWGVLEEISGLSYD